MKQSPCPSYARVAKTREELIEQTGITVVHEMGRLVGLDEDDLYERGLD